MPRLTRPNPYLRERRFIQAVVTCIPPGSEGSSVAHRQPNPSNIIQYQLTSVDIFLNILAFHTLVCLRNGLRLQLDN